MQIQQKKRIKKKQNTLLLEGIARKKNTHTHTHTEKLMNRLDGGKRTNKRQVEGGVSHTEGKRWQFAIVFS